MAAGSRRGEAIGSPADGEASMAAPHGFGPKSSVSITDTPVSQGLIWVGWAGRN